MEKISLLHKKELQEALEKVIDYVISTDSIAIEHYINKLYIIHIYGERERRER